MELSAKYLGEGIVGDAAAHKTFYQMVDPGAFSRFVRICGIG